MVTTIGHVSWTSAQIWSSAYTNDPHKNTDMNRHTWPRFPVENLCTKYYRRGVGPKIINKVLFTLKPVVVVIYLHEENARNFFAQYFLLCWKYMALAVPIGAGNEKFFLNWLFFRRASEPIFGEPAIITSACGLIVLYID